MPFKPFIGLNLDAVHERQNVRIRKKRPEDLSRSDLAGDQRRRHGIDAVILGLLRIPGFSPVEAGRGLEGQDADPLDIPGENPCVRRRSRTARTAGWAQRQQA